MGGPDNDSEIHTQGCVLTQKKPLLLKDVYVAKNIYMNIVCTTVQYLVWEVMVLKDGSLLQVGVYVSKDVCVPINFLIFNQRERDNDFKLVTFHNRRLENEIKKY